MNVVESGIKSSPITPQQQQLSKFFLHRHWTIVALGQNVFYSPENSKTWKFSFSGIPNAFSYLGHFKTVLPGKEDYIIQVLQIGEWCFPIKELSFKDRNEDLSACFSLACRFEVLEVIDRLLDVSRVAYNNLALVYACEVGNKESIKFLLQNNKIKPNFVGNPAILIPFPLMRNRAFLLRLMLDDKHVDPTVNKNQAIEYACCTGDEKLVEMLMADNRVNPADEHNKALVAAALRGHLKIVEMLMTDNRVNPADEHNKALVAAESNGHRDIAELLKKDQRVQNQIAEDTPQIIKVSRGIVKVVGGLFKGTT